MKKALKIILKIIVSIIIFAFSSYLLSLLFLLFFHSDLCGCPGGCGDINMMCDCLCFYFLDTELNTQTTKWIKIIWPVLNLLIPLSLSALYIFKVSRKVKPHSKKN